MLEVQVWEESQHIVNHLYLSVAVGARPNADRRDGEPLGDQLGDGGRHILENYREGARLLDRQRIFQQAPRLVNGATLHAVPTDRIQGLRSQTDVAHDGDSELHEPAKDPGHRGPALEFDRLAMGFLEEAASISNGIVFTSLI